MIITNKDMLSTAEIFLKDVDPKMAELIEEHGPCNIAPWKQSLFPSLINSIISQQLSVKVAKAISGRLLVLMPEVKPKVVPAGMAEGQELSPKAITELSVEELRACGLSKAKTRYCQILAKAVFEGELDLESLLDKVDDEIIDTLITYPGIGKWTAEMFLIYAIGSSDIISYGDLGLKRGMQYYLGLDEHPEQSLFFKTAEQWSPWRSVASWYLWRLAG